MLKLWVDMNKNWTSYLRVSFESSRAAPGFECVNKIAMVSLDFPEQRCSLYSPGILMSSCNIKRNRGVTAVAIEYIGVP